MLDYSECFAHLETLHERYPSSWDLRLIKRPSWLLLKMIRPGMSVLDVGGADRRMGKRIRKKYADVTYKSMDVDRGFPHDFYSLDDIHETFDIVILFEVIEHLDLAEGVGLLTRLRELLRDGGRIVISTPNVGHPHEFWHNATHKTPYMYSWLAGILMSRGYEIIDIYRTYSAPFFTHLFRRTLLYPLHRILDVDFAKSIVVVAGKARGESPPPRR